MLTCKICGAQLLYINTSHLKKHGMTVAEYKNKFGSLITDPSVGKRVSKTNKGVINIGDKNASKREEVRKQISATVSKRWEEGTYDNRINGMIGKFKELSPQWKEENHTPLFLSENNYREFLGNYQDILVCSRCGKSNHKINIHHIDENHSNFLPSNLEPLCVPCHSHFHYSLQKQPFILVGKKMTFAAAHRLPFYEGRCYSWHGHEWNIEVTIKKRVDAKTGMVIDFGKLKQKIEVFIIDKLDHDVVNCYLENPTAENLLVWCWEQLMFGALLKGIKSISIWESQDSIATLTDKDMLSIFSMNIESYLRKGVK